MAIVSARFLALTCCVVVIGLIMLLCIFHVVSAQKECKGTPVPDLFRKCHEFYRAIRPETRPSPECCSAVKGANIPCLYKSVNKDIEKMVSMEKIVYVGRTCGKDIPVRMQCGSYKVPPSMA